MPAASAAKKRASRNPPRSRSAKPAKKRVRKNAIAIAPQATPTPEIPLSSERERIFIEHFLFHHSIEPLLEMKPGLHSIFRRWTRAECESLLASPHIQEQLTQRREQQELANAQLAARSRDLTPEFVRAKLADTIERAWGPEKVRALNLGLIATGVLAKGELAAPPEKPTANVYRALQTTTVQRVTETVTQTREIPPVPAKPALQAAEVVTVKAEAAPPPIPAVEILDY